MSVRDKIAAFGGNSEGGSGSRGGGGAPTRVNKAPSSNSSAIPWAAGSDSSTSQAAHAKPQPSNAFQESRKTNGASLATESHQPSSWPADKGLGSGGAGTATASASSGREEHGSSRNGGAISAEGAGNDLASEAGSKRSVGGSARSAASNGVYYQCTPFCPFYRWCGCNGHGTVRYGMVRYFYGCFVDHWLHHRFSRQGLCLRRFHG